MERKRLFLSERMKAGRVRAGTPGAVLERAKVLLLVMPPKLVRGTGPLVIAGFQNFQWLKLVEPPVPGWGESDSALAVSEEAEQVERAKSGGYGFYGMYELPQSMHAEMKLLFIGCNLRNGWPNILSQSHFRFSEP